MDDIVRPKASPEQAKHMLKELKALAEGGHIKMTAFTLIDPPNQSNDTAEDEPNEAI